MLLVPKYLCHPDSCETFQIRVCQSNVTVSLKNCSHLVDVLQVYGYARRFAKMGIVETLVHTLHEGLSSPCVVSACIALKAVAVNVSLLYVVIRHNCCSLS